MPVVGIGDHAIGDVDRWHVSVHHVIEQNVGERILSFGRGETGRVDVCVGEGLVGRCKHRERPGAPECFGEVGLDHSGDQRIVNSRGLGRGWNVNRWCEHGVDEVDDAVRCLNIGEGHGGRTNGDRSTADAELDVVAVHGGGHHAVLEVAGSNRSADDVVKQKLAQRLVFFRCVVILQIDAGVDERLVGGRKHRERPRTLKRGHQVGVGESGHEGVVDAACNSVAGNVLGGVGAGAERQDGGGQEGCKHKGQDFVHRPQHRAFGYNRLFFFNTSTCLFV